MTRPDGITKKKLCKKYKINWSYTAHDWITSTTCTCACTEV